MEGVGPSAPAPPYLRLPPFGTASEVEQVAQE